MFKLETEIFHSYAMESLTSSKFVGVFLAFFSPIRSWHQHQQRQLASFYHWGLTREENCLKAGELPSSKVWGFYSVVFCSTVCIYSAPSMRKPLPEQKICHVGLSSSLNWQNVLPLYFYNLIFPEHIYVFTYIKAKQVWKSGLCLVQQAVKFVVLFIEYQQVKYWLCG